MCPIDQPTKRKKGVMDVQLFTKIVDDLKQYTNTIQQVDLFGLGEPLLDKNIYEKIQLLKSNGFHNVGISSNCDLLDEESQVKLLQTGLDTLIISIDGTTKETHENIRRNTDYDRVVRNTEQIIGKRNKGGYPTRFLIRFIRQQSNHTQWDEFRAKWLSRLDKSKNDRVSVYDAHNWVGEVPSYGINQYVEEIDKEPCYQITDRMFILHDGTMSMCSCDLHHPHMPIGNVRDENCISVFNNVEMNSIRDFHNSGNKRDIDICSKCSMLY